MARMQAQKAQDEKDKMEVKFKNVHVKEARAIEALLEYQMKNMHAEKELQDNKDSAGNYDFFGGVMSSPRAQDGPESPRAPELESPRAPESPASTRQAAQLEEKLNRSNSQLLEAQMQLMALQNQLKAGGTAAATPNTSEPPITPRTARSGQEAISQLAILKEVIAKSEAQLQESALKCESLESEVEKLKGDGQTAASETGSELEALRSAAEAAAAERDNIKEAAEKDAEQYKELMAALHQETLGSLQLELLDKEKCITKEALTRREKELEAEITAQFTANISLREEAEAVAKRKAEAAEVKVAQLMEELNATAGTKEELAAERDALQEKLKRTQTKAVNANKALMDAQKRNMEVQQEKKDAEASYF